MIVIHENSVFATLYLQAVPSLSAALSYNIISLSSGATISLNTAFGAANTFEFTITPAASSAAGSVVYYLQIYNSFTFDASTCSLP
jgi:hypothetical protein